MGTLLLALFLATLVWIVAVNQENPIEERTLASVPIELVGKADDMLIMGTLVNNTQVRVRAPRLTLAALTARDLRVTADVTDLAPGTYELELQAAIDRRNAEVRSLEPSRISITLERSAARDLPVEPVLLGEPAPGYESEAPQLSAETIAVSGPSSTVGRVARIIARLSIDNLRGDFNGPVNLIPLDSAGSPVGGVDLSPASVQVVVPITQREGYRDVAVKLVITGEVASGYQVTNITVSPNFITVASSDPRLVEQMPGFVDTIPLDLSQATDDIIRRLPLQLPAGVTVDGEQSVLAQVSIAAIEYTLRVERTLEMRGLSPGLSATTSPDTVDVLLLGPLAVLDDLSLEDVRIVVDLEGRGPGTYQLAPSAEVLPRGLRADILLDQVEVVVVFGTPTPTPSEEPTATPTSTVTPTRRPTLPAWTPTPSATPNATETPSP
jgi:YbbR domain-containing protein